ncbi:hypothetical protein PRZ48_010811 [Zasmidium cellare]|uniref:RED-like N-terminal domain-containing protein n=1 Tax=Zasmidium cellare TaxID=395010 RepID=A0ABR0E9P6_ZASCE|nr:hypothetical protein PRZ48_010811 [Zasmidium cellare]
MKNDEFRKLVTASRQDDGSPPQSVAQRALGGKKSSFAGMTPRPGKAVSNADFARQIRERHASLQPTKKHKSSAPKGSKFAAGYTDRAQARREAEEAEDDKEKRIKALEEQVKLGTLSQETFESLRDQIIGDDVSSTHLVKGLDRKLLERVRRGEDVLGLGTSKDGSAPPDVDDELDKLEEKDVEAVAREKTEKKGTKASQIAGVKRTRDEIMADLKAQRKAAAEAKAAAAPSFDSRWRKLGEAAKPKIEIDSKGREVLITVDENGVVKKKIRKVAADPAADAKAPDDTTDASTCKPVLGADVAVPEQPKQQPESEDDDDIFEGAGTEYNPLGDMEDDSDDEDDDDGEGIGERRPEKQAEPSHSDHEVASDEEKKPAPDKPSGPQAVSGPRNYFKDTTNGAEDTQQDRFKGIENVLKKAAQIGAEERTNEDGDDQMSKEEREARAAKRAKMLAQEDRDLEDMDMGFGSSRFEDEEGAADKKQRLSKWKNNTAADDEGWEEDGNEGDAKKKRKGKKRKGDVNNVDDIMKVIEGRKAAGGSK